MPCLVFTELLFLDRTPYFDPPNYYFPHFYLTDLSDSIRLLLDNTEFSPNKSNPVFQAAVLNMGVWGNYEQALVCH